MSTENMICSMPILTSAKDLAEKQYKTNIRQNPSILIGKNDLDK